MNTILDISHQGLTSFPAEIQNIHQNITVKMIKLFLVSFIFRI